MKARPENTAISRRTASRPLRDAIENEWIRSNHRVLDFGCGRGADVRWLLEQGYENPEGFDSHAPFGWHRRPEGQFDVVTAIFVVNVLPSIQDRLDALQDAWSFVAPGGALLVIARRKRDIDSEAKKKGWPRWRDGYWSNRSRGMFQRGHTADDLQTLAAPLNAAEGRLTCTTGYTGILLRKATDGDHSASSVERT